MEEGLEGALKFDNQHTVLCVLKKVPQNHYIILKPITKPRKGWKKAFKKMHENGDDQLLMNDVFEDETFEEWNR